jgi:hypothetical protein
LVCGCVKLSKERTVINELVREVREIDGLKRWANCVDIACRLVAGSN